MNISTALVAIAIVIATPFAQVDGGQPPVTIIEIPAPANDQPTEEFVPPGTPEEPTDQAPTEETPAQETPASENADEGPADVTTTPSFQVVDPPTGNQVAETQVTTGVSTTDFIRIGIIGSLVLILAFLLMQARTMILTQVRGSRPLEVRGRHTAIVEGVRRETPTAFDILAYEYDDEQDRVNEQLLSRADSIDAAVALARRSQRLNMSAKAKMWWIVRPVGSDTAVWISEGAETPEQTVDLRTHEGGVERRRRRHRVGRTPTDSDNKPTTPG